MAEITSKDVATRVESELHRRNELRGAHGLGPENVHQYLVEPRKVSLLDPSTRAMMEFWVVVDEVADSNVSCYMVVYDELSGKFGLACESSSAGDPGVLIGIYGNLVETLNGM